MRPLMLTCPACQYQFELLSALQDSEQRSYWNMIIKSNLTSDQISLLFRYLTMFKPAKNAMSFSSLNARTRELLDMLKSGQVKARGDVRSAPPSMWWAAIEQLVTNKPESLKLPLSKHAYLNTIVFSQAEKLVARKEAQDIESKRNQFRDDAKALKGLQSLTEIVKSDISGDKNAS